MPSAANTCCVSVSFRGHPTAFPWIRISRKYDARPSTSDCGYFCWTSFTHSQQMAALAPIDSKSVVRSVCSAHPSTSFSMPMAPIEEKWKLCGTKWTISPRMTLDILSSCPSYSYSNDHRPVRILWAVGWWFAQVDSSSATSKRRHLLKSKQHCNTWI